MKTLHDIKFPVSGFMTTTFITKLQYCILSFLLFHFVTPLLLYVLIRGHLTVKVGSQSDCLVFDNKL